jgi:DNA end-binding protein Ku
VKARVEAAIQRKVEGQEITVAEPQAAAGEGKVIDLMEALRASLKRNTSARDETSKLSERKPPKRVQKKAAATRKASSR